MIVANVIGSAKNSKIINDVIVRFSDFIDNYVQYNIKYTDRKKFKSQNAWHGWLNQVLMNEAIYNYCFQNSKNKICDDIYILGHNELVGGQKLPLEKSKIKFIDMDSQYAAYLIKAFYYNEKQLYDWLGAK